LFWNVVAILAAVIVSLVALYVVRAMVRNILAARAENARAAERARVADADTMARYKADIDTQHARVAQDELEERIRQALKDRKAEEWGREGASRDPQARE
jgi:flagellar biosynthesis/type III secretory pathway M-ring protein FliF/YscJ